MNASAGQTLYMPVQTISSSSGHLSLTETLAVYFLSVWSWDCLCFCLCVHMLVSPTPILTLLRPHCAHACYSERTLRHMISAGIWEIPFIFPLFFLPFPFTSLPFSSSSCFLQMRWYPGISCKAVLTFRLAADQAVHVFQFLIPVRKPLSELIKDRGGGTITVVLFGVALAYSSAVLLNSH